MLAPQSPDLLHAIARPSQIKCEVVRRLAQRQPPFGQRRRLQTEVRFAARIKFVVAIYKP